jgi:hypothetical protein
MLVTVTPGLVSVPPDTSTVFAEGTDSERVKLLLSERDGLVSVPPEIF